MAERSASTSASSILSYTPMSYFTTPAYHGLVVLARQASLSLFSRLDQPEAKGLLEIVEDGKEHLFGDPSSKRAYRKAKTSSASTGKPTKGANAVKKELTGGAKTTHAVLYVKKDIFWLRLVLGSDLGFAESYMTGEVETPDLGACFKVSFQVSVFTNRPWYES